MAIDWHIDFNPTEKLPKKKAAWKSNAKNDSEFVGFTTPPPSSGGGIFQYVTKINGNPADVRQAQAQLAQLTPETAAIYQTLNLLPEGELKGWLMANPVQFWKKVIELFKGKKYTTGDYVLGERLNDQILCNVGATDIGRKQVSDDMVVQAHTLFNILFGVRIATTEDLDALDKGVAAYKAREASKGISDDAINRAVYLKQNFYPISSYNKSCWDLSYFEKFPLVAPIPDYQLGKFYTGDLPGGAKAVDGVIPINALDIIRQDVGGKVTETGTYTSTTQLKAQAEQKIKEEKKQADIKKYLIIGGIGLVVFTTVIVIIVKRA